MSFVFVEPYLIELVRRMDQENFPLTVAGGLGIHLKRRWVAGEVLERGRKNLFAAVPEARITSDIDVFLNMAVFMSPEDRVIRFRQALAELDYQVLENAKFFQFTKKIGSERYIKLDLHVRLPHDEAENAAVKSERFRVGPRQQSDLKLHGRGTPEAFAIEERPRQVSLVGKDPNGTSFSGTVRVPHPFAALCMKIQAALDHERRPPEQRESKDQKHAFDVYLLLSMLDSEEVEEIAGLVEKFAGHENLAAIQAGVAEIFGAPDGAGCQTIRVQAQSLGEQTLELPRFSAVLCECFGSR